MPLVSLILFWKIKKKNVVFILNVLELLLLHFSELINIFKLSVLISNVVNIDSYNLHKQTLF